MVPLFWGPVYRVKAKIASKPRDFVVVPFSCYILIQLPVNRLRAGSDLI